MKFFKSIIKIICDLWKWLKTLGGISTVALIITMIILILTFQTAYRPYVGVPGADCFYDKSTKDLVFYIKIKNSGNVPANNVRTNMQMFKNSEPLDSLEGQSRFLLFPKQNTFGRPAFHNVEETNLNNDTMEVHVEIKYEQRVKFIIRWCPRKFETTQVLRYDHKGGGLRVISGEST